MHPEIIATCARLHAAELASDAAEARRAAVRRRRLRTRLGVVLIRVGTQLAPTPPALTPKVTLAR